MALSAYVSRLVVEEGFLDGLDVSFLPGLNVLIGPRGVGKTSVIQLLRYCLGVGAFTTSFEASSLRHARDVLGPDGRVSVSVVADGEEFVVSRRARDERPEGPLELFEPPTVLAQTEIEEIGVDPAGRLRLIDGFRRRDRRADDRERALASTIESLSAEISQLMAAIDEERRASRRLVEETAQLAERESELAAAAEASTTSLAPELQRLDQLASESAQSRLRVNTLDAAGETLAALTDALKAISRRTAQLPNWPDDSGDPLSGARAAVAALEADLETHAIALGKIQDELADLNTRENEALTKRDDLARDLRRRVEQAQEGAGLAARRVAALRESAAEQRALADSILDREARLRQTREARSEASAALEALRTESFSDRMSVSEDLNAALGPRISVAVQHSGDSTEYAQAISQLVRGSGLHYADIAPRIAECLPPAELVRAVESDDVQWLTAAVDIPADRARRLFDRIRDVGVGPLMTVPVADAVELRLLDGATYKPTEQLSTGQRCTTVLPILLQHTERPVILDQPEDHLDGAFIVDTLVRAIVKRSPGHQLIAATHNPNVPVLGDAQKVFVLGSDGTRGFEVHSGHLEDPEIVSAITSIMEGGAEAFRRRADFYGALT